MPGTKPKAPFALMGIVAVLSFVSSAYFTQGNGWYQNARFDLVRAIAGEGTVRIDKYSRNTGDKARINGHDYAPMAPGQMFAAAPAVFVARGMLTGRGEDPDSTESVKHLQYVGTVVTGALPTALAAAALLWVSLALGASLGGATFAACAWALGTPAWIYATFFWGHALAASCLVIAFSGAVALRWQGSPRRDVLSALAIGLAGGWATLTEYPAAVPAAAFAAMALRNVWTSPPRRRVRVAIAIAVPAVLCLVALVAYQKVAFGSYWQISYTNVLNQPEAGPAGITHPHLDAIVGMLVPHFRGLVWFAPILVVAPIGWFVMLRRGPDRLAAALAVAVPLFYLFFFSSYAYWNGGYSYGPRHLASGLPFLALALAFAWPRRWPVQVVLMALLALSIAVSAIGISTAPMTSTEELEPFTKIYWRQFQAGRLSTFKNAFNVGQLLGMSGLPSLSPLAGVWFLSAGALLVAIRRARGRPAGLIESVAAGPETP